MMYPKLKLGEICEIVMGQAPDGSSYNEQGLGYPLLAGASDFGDIWPAPKKYTTRPTQISKPHDILLCIRATIGDLNWSDRQYCLGRGVAAFRAKSKDLDPKYLWYFLISNRDKLASEGTGSTFKQVSRSIIERQEIPLPPIAEQRHIAAVLDKADTLRRKRQQALRRMDDLLQSVFLDMFGDPVTNPKGWSTSILDRVKAEGTMITYGIVQAGEHIEGGVPYIKAGDIKRGRIANLEMLSRTSAEIAAKYKRSEVQYGDLVITIRASVGDVALVPKELDGANLTQGTAKISPGENINKYFLLWHIRASGTQAWIEQQLKGATFREITLATLRQMPILTPPMEKQAQFSIIIRKLEVMRYNMSRQLNNANSLFNAIMQQAFSGALRFSDNFAVTLGDHNEPGGSGEDFNKQPGLFA